MPIKKIKDLTFQHDYCNHPEHNAPTMIVLPPGVYEHTCPRCGKKQRFVVSRTDRLLATGSTQGLWKSE